MNFNWDVVSRDYRVYDENNSTPRLPWGGTISFDRAYSQYRQLFRERERGSLSFSFLQTRTRSTTSTTKRNQIERRIRIPKSQRHILKQRKKKKKKKDKRRTPSFSTSKNFKPKVPTCCICADLSVNATLDPCGHMFCLTCVQKFEKWQCPNCRSTIKKAIPAYFS